MENRALTDPLRKRLKKPLGFLMKDSSKENIKRLEKIIREKKPPKIVAVGDLVSKNLSEADLPVSLYIVDDRIMRKKIEPIEIRADIVFETSNLQGTISSQSHEVIKKALQFKGPAKILVNGEEDLLALLAVIYSPEGSLIVYGQPGEGLVLIEATENKKKEIKKIFKRMKIIGS